MKERNALFNPRLLFAVILLGLAAFLGSTYLMIFGDSLQTAGPNTFSHSAIGHRALVETLQRLGLPVSVSRFQSFDKAGTSTLLVLAEPRSDKDTLLLLDRVRRETVVLLVLPKRTGSIDPDHPQWLQTTDLLETSDVTEVLTTLLSSASVVRQKTGAPYENGWGHVPAINDLQLVRSDKLSPIIAYREGILLGETKFGSAKVWVLSDPDLISNAGLGQNQNAAIAYNLFSELTPKGGAIIFDEVIHGFEQAPDMLRTAFEPPFITATIAFVLATLFGVLAGVTRLGAPAASGPVLAAGRETLLRNIAELLEYGRGAGTILARYPQLVVAEVASRLKAPKSLDEAGQITWLDRRAKKLGLSLNATDLLARGSDLARQRDLGRGAAMLGPMADRWKKEMLHGSRRRTGD